MEEWNAEFAEQSPLLKTLRAAAGRIAGGDWPDLSQLQELIVRTGIRTASDLPLQLVPQATAGAGESYEQRLYRHGELEFRERNWHDLFNVLVWLTFPRAKAALNARHHAAAPASRVGRRGPVRDALTLFDESGVIVLSMDAELLHMIREFQWRPLFLEQRSAVVEDMVFLPFGHALCEKALAPYKGLTGRGLLLKVGRDFLDLPAAERLAQTDRLVALRIADPQALRHTQELAPLPVLGVPGWCADNEQAAYYDDRAYFRPGRTRHTTAPHPVDHAVMKES
ncbi:MAG: DUF3025 domain-containing protein [Burkholderiales bacterium]|nr:DUF3025 domain-containing protein [Burkholderiales bacterium]